jgi:hypothetical protein
MNIGQFLSSLAKYEASRYGGTLYPFSLGRTTLTTLSQGLQITLCLRYKNVEFI